MSAPEPIPTPPLADLDDDEASELAALEAAVAKADANPCSIPHEEVRAWLLRLAEGDFNAPPPVAACFEGHLVGGGCSRRDADHAPRRTG